MSGLHELNALAALHEALLSLRHIAGQRQVCPVCFAEAVITALTEIKKDLTHNEMLEPVTMEALRKASAQMALQDIVEDCMGPTKGNA